MDLSFLRPRSLRVNDFVSGSSPMPDMVVFGKNKDHEMHSDFGHLVLLVFEAVMEVVCVSLPGYIIARLGHFDADKQKFLANLNVMLFTPCLIFTKLAAQLNAEKLADLAVIPVIFVVQTLVSYGVSIVVSKAFRFEKRPANFVTAMGVFGNSNSLPISLVISLSQTLKGLHWDRIPGDNDDEVAARGILYLLIFQQLGQLVRWSWGYHVLLAPKSRYDEYQDQITEEGGAQRYRDEPENQTNALMPSFDGQEAGGDVDEHSFDGSEIYEPAGRTPVAGASRASPADSEDEGNGTSNGRTSAKKYTNGDLHGSGRPFGSHSRSPSADNIMSFPRMRDNDEPYVPGCVKGLCVRAKLRAKRVLVSVQRVLQRNSQWVYLSLPSPLQMAMGKTNSFIWEFMNPPLWAMLIAVFVASVPDLQRLFFQEGSFIKNSVTTAISSSAGVAVPLILVVLGANLARSTEGGRESMDAEEKKIGTKLLIASLISRMLLPTLIMAPLLALLAKYVPVSILDDPIFVIVCFLLVGAPSALQLAQICQINDVYEGVMAKILFQGYVVWILPSTLILVMLALETVEWAR